MKYQKQKATQKKHIWKFHSIETSLFMKQRCFLKGKYCDKWNTIITETSEISVTWIIAFEE